ncbi:MAG TPA: SCO family protein, partial [Gemmatales bacterium]|nr:SCO family protein [Gemmatales bacterium]
RFERTLEQLDRKEPIPIQLQGVGIVEQIGAPLPLDLVFRDETGKKRPLGSYFQSGKPIILTLNYSDCPQLCHIQLNNFVEVMDTHKILPGQDFEIITVSINPNEGPTKARNAKKNYLKELNASSESWHFLTTDDESTIKKLAQVVGFNYKYDPIKKDYAHSSTLIFCSPGGVVTQYYQGIVYEPKELTRKIDEARQGIQLASDIDENFLNCKVIDNSKPFATLSMKIMKVVASIVAVGLILTLAILWMLPNRYPAVLPPLEGVKHT